MIVNKKFLKSFTTLPGKTGCAIELKLFSGIHLLRIKSVQFEAFVNCSAGNSFTNNIFIGAYWKLTAKLILLSILSIIKVDSIQAACTLISIAYKGGANIRN